jgi:hypothetical protein
MNGNLYYTKVTKLLQPDGKADLIIEGNHLGVRYSVAESK